MWIASFHVLFLVDPSFGFPTYLLLTKHINIPNPLQISLFFFLLPYRIPVIRWPYCLTTTAFSSRFAILPCCYPSAPMFRAPRTFFFSVFLSFGIQQVDENPDVAKKINGIIAWNVGDQKWVADLKQGKVYEGELLLQDVVMIPPPPRHALNLRNSKSVILTPICHINQRKL